MHSWVRGKSQVIQTTGRTFRFFCKNSIEELNSFILHLSVAGLTPSHILNRTKLLQTSCETYRLGTARIQ